MTHATTLAAHRTAARWAGAMYLFTMTTAVVSEMVLTRGLIVPGNAAQTAHNVLAHEHLFRMALFCDVLTALGVTGIIAGLHILLRPAQASLSTQAAMWRLTENAFSYVPIAFACIALWFLRDTSYLTAFTEPQKQVLSRCFLYAHADCLSLVFIPCGVGSACFALALHRARYVPRWLAFYGIAASMLMALTALFVMVIPKLGDLQLTLMMPMGVYELSLGFFLVLGFARLDPETP